MSIDILAKEGEDDERPTYLGFPYHLQAEINYQENKEEIGRILENNTGIPDCPMPEYKGIPDCPMPVEYQRGWF